MLTEERELPFDHPVAIDLRRPGSWNRPLARTQAQKLGLDASRSWMISSVVWKNPGAKAVVTLRAPVDELDLPRAARV
jgi:hypothetical protein